MPRCPLPCCRACPQSRPSSLGPMSFAYSYPKFDTFHVLPLSPSRCHLEGRGSASHCDWAMGTLTTLLPDSWFDKFVVFKNLKCRTPLSVCLYFWNICITYN